MPLKFDVLGGKSYGGGVFPSSLLGGNAVSGEVSRRGKEEAKPPLSCFSGVRSRGKKRAGRWRSLRFLCSGSATVRGRGSGSVSLFRAARSRKGALRFDGFRFLLRRLNETDQFRKRPNVVG